MTGRTYRIGEAARLLKLEGYVLRFWETEFEQLRPLRTPKGQRLYSDADLVVLRRIRTLLYEQGMTIEGARRVLERECAESGDGKARTSAEDMEDVNRLVLQGVPFREAYRRVGEQVQAGTYRPTREVRHTHEGSIGNLCNDRIRAKMERVMERFE